jgi:hypothetical protein
MTKYRVYLVATASTTVEVEAEDGEAAVEQALSGDLPLPFAPAFAGFDLGDWTTESELSPQYNKPEDDYEEVA